MTPEGAIAAGSQQCIVGIVLCLWSWDGEAMFVWDFFSGTLRTIYLTKCCWVLKSLSDKDLAQRTKVFGVPRQKVSMSGQISHDKVSFQFHQAYYNFGKQRAVTAKERQKKKKLWTRNSSRSCPHQKIRSRP